MLHRRLLSLFSLSLGALGCGASGDTQQPSPGNTAGQTQAGQSGQAQAGQSGQQPGGQAGAPQAGQAGAGQGGAGQGGAGQAGSAGQAGAGQAGAGLAGSAGQVSGAGAGGAGAGGAGQAGAGQAGAGQAGAGQAGASGGSQAGASQGGICPDHDPLKRVFWGDLHVHTSYSLDAYFVGNEQNGPGEAYAYARGQSLTVAGSPRKLDRPLDFLGVTDHSEFFDVMGECTLPDKNGKLKQTPYCLMFRGNGETPTAAELARFVQLVNPDPTEPSAPTFNCNTVDCEAIRKNVWQRTIDAAQQNDDPCAFTAFVAYEYTGNTGNKNMHRNVIFRGASAVGVPLDYIHYRTLPEMWAGLDAECKAENGCEAVLIPHSSNDSQGEKWLIESEADAAWRQKYELLAEIYQHKGSSECLNASGLDPADPGYDSGCDFELATALTGDPDPATDRPGYVRAGLSQGIERYASTGKNPLELGIIASTDGHNTTPGDTEEDRFIGNNGAVDDTASERLKSNPRFGPGGLAAVWAEENTRESLFAALKRRETYGTSGPRITVRFYQVWSDQDFCADPDFPAAIVAAGGVPMGGHMTPQGGALPRFVVFAQRDKNNLREIDLIEGVVSGGKAAETVLRAQSSDPSGDATLCRTFQPSAAYDPQAPSYWYARVLEVPSPRWSHFDCQVSPADCGGLDVMISERAWTSPIWLAP